MQEEDSVDLVCVVLSTPLKQTVGMVIRLSLMILTTLKLMISFLKVCMIIPIIATKLKVFLFLSLSLSHTHTVTEFMNIIYSITVNNPVISIPQADLMQQAASLGTPVSAVLNSPSFAEVVPGGVTIPQVGGPTGNGAATTTFLTLSSLLMMLTFSFFGIY